MIGCVPTQSDDAEGNWATVEPRVPGQASWPFCDDCTTRTDGQTVLTALLVNGFGTALLGGGSRCGRCGSVSRRLFFCFCFIPVVPLDRYRVIEFGNGAYFGRRLLSASQEASAVAVRHLAAEPVSAVIQHPELQADDTCRRADGFWLSGHAEPALRLYEAALETHGRVLPPDDPSMIRLRLRAAQARMATNDSLSALAWFEHLAGPAAWRFGPEHPVTRSAIDGARNAMSRMGGPGQVAVFLRERIEREGGEERADNASKSAWIRLLATAGRANDRSGKLQWALWCFEGALDLSYKVHGQGHPDTAGVLEAFAQTCDRVVARPRNVRLLTEVLAAQEFWLGADHPDTHATRERLGRRRR
jgi:hypothetical protein